MIIDSFMNRAAEMFEKRTEEIAIERGDRASGINKDAAQLAGIRRSRLGGQRRAGNKIRGSRQACPPSLAQERTSISGKHVLRPPDGRKFRRCERYQIVGSNANSKRLQRRRYGSFLAHKHENSDLGQEA